MLLDKPKASEAVEVSIRLRTDGQTAGRLFSDIKLASLLVNDATALRL